MEAAPAAEYHSRVHEAIGLPAPKGILYSINLLLRDRLFLLLGIEQVGGTSQTDTCPTLGEDIHFSKVSFNF
jgi:hypothetical protein